MKAYHLFFLGGLFVGGLATVLALDPRGTAGADPVAALAWQSEEERRTIDVYRRANESVVFITTISLGNDPIELLFEQGPREGTGSGCVIDAERGIVITNLHVVQDARKIEITLASGENVRAQLLGYDPETDLAVLKLLDPPRPLTAVPLGDSSRLAVGQRVLAIGNPFGLNRTLTTGIVSSTDRTVRISNQRRMKGLIQTDAAINPGNSGGPLLDLDGRLIGLNTAILSASGDSAGIGFAVPINTIKRVLPDLVTKGRVLRPFIGWALIDTNQGPFIERVLPESPADRAGVETVLRRVENVFLKGYVHDFGRADLIYKVNGTRVFTRDEVEDVIVNSSARDPIRFTLRRGGINGREREVEITPILR